MLEKILNLEGVAVLSKTEQKLVSGGQTCRITTVFQGQTFVYEYSGYAEGEAGSAQAANETCAAALSQGWERCFYDCEYDGFGQ